ncbi:MAG: hypothetical protein Q8O64_17945, partial [Sideroxyarcus sp.]|nr:hypothetical protein [Sideroxyarcus sp.]
VAMFLSIGGANAEISTVVKSLTGDTVKLPNGTECFVKERTFFGNGGASSLSCLFTDGGLVVSNDKKSDCVIVVGAAVSVQHKNNATSTMVTEVVQENDVMEELKGFAENDTQDDPRSTVGETVGASVGATFGLAGAAAGAIVGSALDSRKSKYLSATAVGLRANLEFKNAQGKSARMEVSVATTADSTERPVTLLRAAVKRVVAEMQATQDGSNSTSASAKTEIPTQEVH